MIPPTSAGVLKDFLGTSMGFLKGLLKKTSEDLATVSQQLPRGEGWNHLPREGGWSRLSKGEGWSHLPREQGWSHLSRGAGWSHLPRERVVGVTFPEEFWDLGKGLL